MLGMALGMSLCSQKLGTYLLAKNVGTVWPLQMVFPIGSAIKSDTCFCKNQLDQYNFLKETDQSITYPR